jgi:membrane-bound metal-dependent hydrolase YbcI (DUF457 family)
MTYKTHLSTGLLFSAILFLMILKTELTPALALTIFFATILGSSSPDLDTPTGELWDKIPAGSVISRVVHPVFIGGHRHLSHSFLGLVLFMLLFLGLLNLIPFPLIHNTIYIILCAYGTGYVSHLFADSFTEAGVPWLFPLPYHFGIPPIAKMRIKTGKWFENLIIYPAVNFLLIIVVVKYFLAHFH